MTQPDWLHLVAEPALRARIAADPVLPLHPHLLAQFAAWTPLTWPDAVTGLHIAYGWMPTIPNLHLPASLEVPQQTAVVTLLNAARSRLLTGDELGLLKATFCNNSMVGVSKLLQFIAPDRHPIWDGRVARAWYAPAKAYPYRYDRPAEYLAYAATVRAWAADPGTAAARAAIRALSPHLQNASDVRIIELVLFHA